MAQDIPENEGLPKKLTLVMGNMYEFNTRYRGFHSIESLVYQRGKKENFAVSSEMALFWGGDSNTRIVVLPILPDHFFVEDIAKRLGVRIKCLSPTLVTGWVCRDLLMDNNALEELVQHLRDYEVSVMSWGATFYYYQILKFLLEKGVKIIDSHCPSIEDYWSIDYCDSKIGSRSIIEQMHTLFPRFGVPSGYVCHNQTEALALSEMLVRRSGQPVILKSDIGSGGKGIRFYHPGDVYNSLYQSKADLVASIDGDELWQNVHIIVEAAIGKGVNLSTPSFDGFIHANGSCSTVGVENMLTVDRQCIGIEMGVQVIEPDVYNVLEQVGIKIGEHIAHLGYRGWYDIDFLLPKSGSEFYASEINTRRGGATSPIEFAQRLCGPLWKETVYVKSFERLWLERPLNGYDELQFIIDAIHQHSNHQMAGIMPLYSNSIQLRRPYLGYLIYGPSRDEVATIESELHAHLPI